MKAGDQLGSYEILALLGAGGMGEVYRARDLKLKREVAIKILPERFARDADRVGRFQREAEVLATLNHPNIAAIYHVQEANNTRFLVLELVDGETLAERIRQGPLPVGEALKIAHQIACALEAAHAKGIIHRDLKPANVKITTEGKAKVLDFGLAKAVEPPSFISPNLSDSPTMDMMATNPGVILGTVAYMSPEQAKGLALDPRSDVFSLGCILYEMLSGRQSFQGGTPSEVLASVLIREPDWSCIPANVNPRTNELVQRCLEKDATHRWQAAGDVREEIERLLSAPTGTGSIALDTTKPNLLGRRVIPVLLSAILAAVAVIATWYLKPSAPAPVTKFPLVLPSDQVFTQSERHLLSLSPDGTKLVYVANNQLFLRRMSETDAQTIQGAGGGVANPFFSPDGSWVGFWSIADSQIKKVALAGGGAIPICNSSALFGASWYGNQIVFAESGKGIMRVSANGGQPETLVSIKSDEGTADSPQMIDGGRAILFTIAEGEGPDRWDRANIVVQSLASSSRKVIRSGGSDAHYLPSGHVIYAQRGNVLAVPFDPKRFEANGNAVVMIEGVWRATAGQTGAAHLTVADTGALAFIPGGPGGAAVRTTLALVDQSGRVEALPILPGQYVHPRISPDGRQLAFMTDDGTEQAVWIYDMSGGVEPRRLTLSGRSRYPIWTPDGLHVIFTSDREGDNGLYRQRADGTQPAERLTKADAGSIHFALSVDPSGKILAFYNAQRGSSGIWLLPLNGGGKAEPFPETPNSVQPTAIFSPDGRWLTYSTTEKGPVPQIFVRSYNGADSKYQITTEGGGMPLWSADSKQLIYLGGPNRYLVLDIRSDLPVPSGKPSALPVTGIIQPLPGMRNYDLTSDRKLLVVVPSFSKNETNPRPMLQINIVLNWFTELQQRVPVK
jgi:eukaryotic-like serine/threonine-protein kinase